MVYIAFALLLLAAVACLGLSQAVPTRIPGFLAAAISFITALLLVAGPSQGWAGDVPALTWATLEDVIITVDPQLGGVGLVLGFVMLIGASLALLDLSLALAPTVRGFGGLFAWILLALAATLIGLSSSGMMLPFSWASVVLLSYCSVRSSGALNRSEHIPQGVALGLLTSALLMVGLLLSSSTVAAGVFPDIPAILCIVLACLLLMGAAPFQNALSEVVLAPAALGGLLYGIILPALALGTLIRFVSDFRLEAAYLELPPIWHNLLFTTGLLSVITGAAGALRERSLRHVLAWQAMGQAGLVVLAVGLQAILASIALLANLALCVLIGALAVSVMERLTGSDDVTQHQPGVDLRFPGLLWALGAASALGLPGLWGFWSRLWLFEAMATQANWLIPPVLAASVFMFLAYVSPLARFWSMGSSTTPVPFNWTSLQATNPFLPVLMLAPLPLVVSGVFPQLVWSGFLTTMPGMPQEMNIGMTAQVSGVIVLLSSAVALWFVSRCRSARHIIADEDMESIVLAPDALAASLTPLAALGQPTRLIRGTWAWLQAMGRMVHTGLSLFEQRFYLAGVLLALICLILMMAQG